MLEIRSVQQWFSATAAPLHVINDLSVSISNGEFVVLVGPSGCGKTTLLRLIAGLEAPSAGQVLIDGVSPDPRGKHTLGFVFQEPALLPWRTLLRNVTLGLEARGIAEPERKVRAGHLLGLLGLNGFQTYYPHQVSGGMKHRVAIARAYILDPIILLMDEPFVALDAQTREELQQDLVRLWTQLRRTVVFVTHSLEEAILLATRVIVFSARPASIVLDRRIDLPYPRDPVHKDFVDLRQELRELLAHHERRGSQ
jgi:NitT/TauT family transport system ATP-binding protein